MTKSPLALVKERFSNKEGLVAAVKALATDELWNSGRLNEDKGLKHVSNKKLLHLHDVLSSVKKDHGSRAKLIDVLLDAQKRTKDAGYKSRLEQSSTPDLYNQLIAAKKRTKAAEKAAAPKAKASEKPKTAAKKKAAPKKAAPKKKAGAAKAPRKAAAKKK
jgi:hypothetical protein